jgi:restriction system protein
VPIPDYQTVMLPLLKATADGQTYKMRDLIELLAREFNVSDEERTVLLPSGTAPLFDNRVGWARTYLKKAGLLSSPRRGAVQVTDRGKDVLRQPPVRITVGFLDQFEEFRFFRTKRREEGANDGADELEAVVRRDRAEAEGGETPEDSLARAYAKLRQALVDEVLEQLKSVSPAFFERLVVDLLVRMGYGGSRQDAGKAIGRSGDGGIDGVISEDRLGLDAVYVQAKRWEATVGRPEIQKFSGALQGQRANKGVFITTSDFSRDAVEYAGVITTKIVLVDGVRLANLMIDHNVGVTPVGAYELKRLDSDYFDEA